MHTYTKKNVPQATAVVLSQNKIQRHKYRHKKYLTYTPPLLKTFTGATLGHFKQHCWATRYRAKKRPSNCVLRIVQHSCAMHCNLQQLFHSLQCSTPVWDTHLHHGQSHVASGHNRPAWDGWSGRLERQRWQIRNQGRRSSAPDFDIFPLLQNHQMKSGNKAGSQFCFGNSSFSRVGQR